nr:hypothetical protein [Tanacetum cinerariifolium]
MDMIIDQQVALDEALVPHASRLRIGKSNFCLRSDITFKESTLQLVYDVLRLTPFYKAFLMNNKKRIINLEYFREMLHICPRLPNHAFDELLFEEEILAFLRYLGHSGEIRKLTDVNINKLHQPWRSFAAVINKCISGKSTCYDSLRLSQAHILWGMYHKKNVDFSYLLWEDFIYQVEQKDAKKSNEMYYLRFTKVIIYLFMTKDPSIPRRNKFSAMLPVELTNEDIKNSAAYKEYYAVASGVAPPKTNASVRKTHSSFDITITPPTAAGIRLSTSGKGKQPAMSSKAKGLSVLSEVAMTAAEQMKLATKRSLQQTHSSFDITITHPTAAGIRLSTSGKGKQPAMSSKAKGLSVLSEVAMTEAEQMKLATKRSLQQTHISYASGSGADEGTEEAKDEESFDPIVQTPENSDDEGNDDASLGLNVGGEEGLDAEDDDEELYRDVNINLEGRDVQMTYVHTMQEFEDTH